MEAASRARYGGDRTTAIQLYEKAASLAQEGVRRAEIRFALGLLYADSGGEARDLERLRAELSRAVSDAPDGPRAAEARLLVSLIEELIALRAQTAEMKTQSEAARTEMAALNARLQEKEKELAEIKKILLQDKRKP
jgi:DNA repair exonuclease SbcCD ATPase subunit